MVVKKKAKKTAKKKPSKLYAVIWPNSDVTVIQATSEEDAIEIVDDDDDDENKAEPLGAMELTSGFRLEMTFTRKEDYSLELDEDSESDIVDCVRTAQEDDDDEEDEDDDDEDEDEDEDEDDDEEEEDDE